MTLTSTTTKLQYNGDGSTVSFPITFVFWLNADIKVIHKDAAGTETTWALGTQYTLTGGAGSTGTLTVEVSPTDYTPASGETLTIKSIVPNTQTTALPLGGKLPSSSIEERLDKNVRLVQQRGEELDRAMLLSETSSLSNLTFPSPGAGNYIRWNVAGDALEAVSVVNDSGNFLQSGTGAVSRSVTSKIGETLSVTDFGATGDGVTDDTVNIQAAIDAAKVNGGGVVFLPRGTYKISSSLTIDRHNIVLSGEGAGNYDVPTATATTEIVWAGIAADNMIDFIGNGTAVQTRCGMNNIALDGAEGCERLILIRDHQNFDFTNIAGRHSTVYGIEITNDSGATNNPTGFGHFHNVRLLMRGQTVLTADGVYLNGLGTGSAGVTHIQFHNLRIEHADGHGVLFGKRADGNSFYNLFTFRANTTESGFGVNFQSSDTGAILSRNVFYSANCTGGANFQVPSASVNRIPTIGSEFHNFGVDDLNTDLTDQLTGLGVGVGKSLIRGYSHSNRPFGLNRLLHEHHGNAYNSMKFMFYDTTNQIVHTSEGTWKAARVGTGTITANGQAGGGLALETSGATNDSVEIRSTSSFGDGVASALQPYVHFCAAPATNISSEILQMGLFGDAGAPNPVDGIYVENDPASSANWRLVSRASSSSTVITTTIPVAVNVKRHWLILLDNGVKSLFLTKLPTEKDWTYLGVTATNVPNTPLSEMYRIITTTTAFRRVDIYFSEFGHDLE